MTNQFKAACIKRELAFSVAESKKRVASVRKTIKARGLDALLVSTPESIYYLSGFNTPGYYITQCLILPASGEPIIVCRGTEEMNVVATSWLTRSASYADDMAPVVMFAEMLKKAGLARARIGIDKNSWFIPIMTFEKLQALLPKAKFVDGSMTVEPSRLIKSPAEVALIRKGAEIASDSMLAAFRAIRVGATEDEVASEVSRVYTLKGGEWPGLPAFVCSGVRTSYTHATNAGRVLKKGDPVLLELPGVTKRYVGALTRTRFVGDKGDKKVERMYDTSRKALEAHLGMIRPGRSLGEVWDKWAKVLEDAGHGKTNRRAGYSIGINYPPDWGEGYILGFQRGEKRELQENMTFHVISLVKEFGLANVGCSATIRVTKSGCEMLSKFDDFIKI